MTRPIVKIHDITTDEVYEREMNDEEFAQWQIDKAKGNIEQEIANAKKALLEKLGITEEEAKLLLS